MNIGKNLGKIYTNRLRLHPVLTQIREGTSLQGVLCFGAKKGGASIRKPDSPLGKIETSNEDEYFYKLKIAQLKQIKNDKGTKTDESKIDGDKGAETNTDESKKF